MQNCINVGTRPILRNGVKDQPGRYRIEREMCAEQDRQGALKG